MLITMTRAVIKDKRRQIDMMLPYSAIEKWTAGPVFAFEGAGDSFIERAHERSDAPDARRTEPTLHRSTMVVMLRYLHRRVLASCQLVRKAL